MHTLLLAFVSLAGATGAQRDAPAVQSPLAGTWTVNLSKSKLHPNYPIQSGALQFTVTGDRVTVTSAVAPGARQAQQGAEIFPTDGTERPSALSPGVALRATWRGTHILETRARSDGREIAVVTYEVSADGQTLTAKASDSTGLEHVIVFDRQ